VWRGRWLPRCVLGLAGVALLGLNVYNPDARIAARNIERYARTGRIDLSYMANLSADAVPALTALDHPGRDCVLHTMRARLSSSPGSVMSFNLSRRRALEVIQREAPGVGSESPGCPPSL
ncbi:DUF4153 domain-containing protein, partial [Staphylococcus aureus]|uniref:DUF4153 domain-containing protein n=1 Tax=Staphylococcus aureus TaxID=1280 RepID=UPI000F88B7C5